MYHVPWLDRVRYYLEDLTGSAAIVWRRIRGSPLISLIEREGELRNGSLEDCGSIILLSAPRPVFCQHGVGLGKDGGS